MSNNNATVTTTKSAPPSAGEPKQGRSAEETLDALLQLQQQQEAERAAQQNRAQAARPDPREVLRRQMREELIPAFEELKSKYGAQSVGMKMDASDFLGGGRAITFEFSVSSHVMRLKGSVVEGRIAFSEFRSKGAEPGVLTGGPMLLTRTLTADTFREFVCERVGQLVRSILRQSRGGPQ